MLFDKLQRTNLNENYKESLFSYVPFNIDNIELERDLAIDDLCKYPLIVPPMPYVYIEKHIKFEDKGADCGTHLCFVQTIDMLCNDDYENRQLLKSIFGKLFPLLYRYILDNDIRWIVSLDYNVYNYNKFLYDPYAMRMVVFVDSRGDSKRRFTEVNPEWNERLLKISKYEKEHEIQFDIDLDTALSEYPPERYFDVFMFAISLTNCKNVYLVDNPPSSKLSKRNEKEYGSPLVVYKTIQIEQGRTVSKNENTYPYENVIGANTLPLTIWRGHFKDYREGNGLFGRLHDVYYWNQHIRGLPTNGVNVNSYELKSKKNK